MQQAAEAEQQQVAIEAQNKAEENRIKEEDSIRKSETDITVALIGANAQEEEDGEGLEIEKINLQKEKIKTDEKLKRAQLNETVRSNKAKESIARSKPKTTTTKK